MICRCTSCCVGGGAARDAVVSDESVEDGCCGESPAKLGGG
uniref:Uncharacterized protein n=1 Tax=Arundo donax TaxID=35708 RepID=A0A0A9BSY9_ARUDO